MKVRAKSVILPDLSRTSKYRSFNPFSSTIISKDNPNGSLRLGFLLGQNGKR